MVRCRDEPIFDGAVCPFLRRFPAGEAVDPFELMSRRNSFPDRLLQRINALEAWLQEGAGKPHLLPVRLAGYGLLLILLLLSNLVALCRWPFAAWLDRRSGASSAAGDAGPEPAGEPVAVDADSLRELRSSGGLVLVDLWAAWCGPCIMMNGSLRRVAEDFSGACVVAKVDTVQHADLAEEHNVRGLPTLILYRGDEELERHAGALSYAELRTLLEKHLPRQPR